ncbi:unnamed protein product [Lymnaea stagnalis]|uniref:Uncharacterized protein n=1 Tax=Lymnaea stagnalis TaxID=6523 RepID=A0AAV2I0T0_LYMST
MALPGGVSVLALVAVCTIGVGVLLHVIGLATPNWSAISDKGFYRAYGLWKSCGGTIEAYDCDEYKFGNKFDESESSVKACEAFAILGMLASFLGLAMAALSVLLPIIGKPKNAILPVIALAGCVAAFICILIAIVVWGAKVHAEYLSFLDIGYSFILSIIGGILIVVGGVLAYIGNKRIS